MSDPITLSDVRAKFPQYKDVPDDQLVQGLHQKYYSDVPFDKFAESVGYSKPQSPILDNPVVGGAEDLLHHVTGGLAQVPAVLAGGAAGSGVRGCADRWGRGASRVARWSDR